MNADDFRGLFEFHFTRNREIWEHCVMSLDLEKFKRKTKYSVGSVRNQCVHLLNIDERWFAGFRGDEVPGFYEPDGFKTFEEVRQKWDQVEAMMRGYLAGLSDEMLEQEFMPGMKLWQVLHHVLNHGTDHRAQLLQLLDSLGAPTFAQDYFFFANKMPIKLHDAN
jgi:uncharacterized damage-inducible protein DinB